MLRLQDRIALVTGGSGGLGGAFATALAGEGAHVAVHYRSGREEALAVAERVTALGRRAVAVEADVSDATGVRSMFERLDRELGPVDVLVNNAGVDGERGVAWEIEPESWRRTVEINLFGAFHAAREALRRMVPRRTGVIVNISSVHEVIPWGGYSAYAAAKAGLAMMTRTLALEAAPFGVRVVGLAPGAIRTPINQDVWGNPAGLADLNAKIPMARIGEPDEVARLLVALASDDSSYVTGATFVVDGGMTLYADFAQGG